MLKIVVTIVLLVSVSLTAGRDRSLECPENEQFTRCGTVCPLECGKPPQICVPICYEGCECKTNFLRNEEYKCVLPSDC